MKRINFLTAIFAAIAGLFTIGKKWPSDERIVMLMVGKNKWKRIRFRELRSGDVFRMYDHYNGGTPVGSMRSDGQFIMYGDVVSKTATMSTHYIGDKVLENPYYWNGVLAVHCEPYEETISWGFKNERQSV